jgi:hypothetical protein
MKESGFGGQEKNDANSSSSGKVYFFHFFHSKSAEYWVVQKMNVAFLKFLFIAYDVWEQPVFCE